MKQARDRTGRFRPGHSGNPAGRPPKHREQRADARETRTDGFVNPYTGTGTARDRRIATSHVTRPVTDLEAIDLRRGNWLAARIIEMLPADAYRRGYELKLGDKGQAEKVQATIEELGLNEKLVEAAQKEREAGGAALFPVLDGAVGDLSEPLVIERGAPRIGKVLAVHLLQPRELQPWSWYTRLSDPKFREPETYLFTPINARGGEPQQIIHESRLAIYSGIKFTPEHLPGQRTGFGDSVLTRVNEVLSDFGLSWASAAAILHDFSQGVIKFENLLEILKEEGGWRNVEKRARRMDMTRSSLRAMILGKGDEFSRTTTSVAGLAELLQQFMVLVSAAADMSVVRLFGISPAGLNATGQSDIELTDDRTIAKQAEYRRPTEWLIKLLLNSADGPTRGHEPDVWSIEWRALRSPSEKERAETRKTVAETDKIYYDIEAASSDDIARSRWSGDTYSAEMEIDWDAREAQKRIDEERAEELEQDPAAMAALRGEDAELAPDIEPSHEN